MASDTDLFQKRVYWGFAKTYKAACQGATAADLKPSIVRAVRNALRGDLRCPGLKALIGCAAEFASPSEGSLFRDQQFQAEARFRARLDSIERTFADYESTRIARQAIEAAAYELAENPTSDATDFFCEGVAKQFFDRYAFDPIQCDVSRSRNFSREEMEHYRAEAFAACRGELVDLLKGAARSSSGVPASRRKQKQRDINTVEGLDEPIGARS